MYFVHIMDIMDIHIMDFCLELDYRSTACLTRPNFDEACASVPGSAAPCFGVGQSIGVTGISDRPTTVAVILAQNLQ